MNKIKLMLKMMYVLIPRIIRQQFFDDSVHLYKEVLKKLISKIQNSTATKKLQLVGKIEQLECEYETLFTKSNRENTINKPKLFVDGKNYFKPSLEGIIPDINVYKVKNVSIVGCTDAIINNNKFLHYELSLMEDWHDLKRWDIFNKIEKDLYTVAIKYDKKKSPLSNKIYISLLKEHSVNYYHFMTEGLPRFIQIVQSIENFNPSFYALLIDDEMPKQCIEAIELVLDSEIEIIAIKKGEIFYCKELLYCTPLWTSLDNTTGLPNPKKEFFVDKYAINLVREKLLTSYKPQEHKIDRFKKVYLQRLNNKLRPISNLRELELLLLKNDFEFVDVGSLNLKEQIEFFQTVDLVVGVSGAAFTNLLFMKGGSTVIDFYPSVSATNYYIFQPLADVSNVDLIHFLTTPKYGELSLHAEASIDLKSLEKLLKEERFV